jgi:hypothetical protein
VSGWIDDAARRLAFREAGMTRGRVLRLAAGTGLALAAGPLVERAGAEDYCFDPCERAARNRLNAELDRLRSLTVRSLPACAVPFVCPARLGALGAYLANLTTDYYDQRADCRGPNCGDKTRYPPPGPGGNPPPPPPPAGSGPCDTCKAYCSPCAKVALKYICCVFPPKDGASPCC